MTSAKPTIAVLRGGPSSEHEVSLNTGEGMLAHMDTERFLPRDVVIRKDGTWTVGGAVCATPQEALQGVDAVLIGLHGVYGEDGTVQALLDASGVPYAGTTAEASRIGMSKALTHAAVAKTLVSPVTVAPRTIVTPHEWRTHAQTCAALVTRDVGFPCVVKPAQGGSSVGVTMVRDGTPAEMTRLRDEAISALVAAGEDVVVERYVAGREVTCAVVEGVEGVDIRALPLVEVVLRDDQPFFDYAAKYGGTTREVCPANVDARTARAISDAAIAIHTTLGLRDYSRSDFIISDDGSIVFLEVNTLPGMTPTSFVPQALAAVGISYTDFVTHLITRTLSRGATR